MLCAHRARHKLSLSNLNLSREPKQKLNVQIQGVKKYEQ